MRKKSKEEIDQISTILIKELTDKSELNIKRIILYGSYARGEADDYSDMDVMVLCDNREEELDKKRYSVNSIGSDISLDNDIDIELKIKDVAQFNEWLDVVPFYQNVIKEGVVLYE